MNSAKRHVLHAIGIFGLTVASGCSGCSCSACGKAKDLIKEGEHPRSEGGATSHELLTKVGLARALSTHSKDTLPPTVTKWTRVFPLDASSALLGGAIENQALMLRTNDGGRSWSAYFAAAPPGSLVSYTVGADKSAVIAVAQRQIPKNKLPKGKVAPIDTLTLFFQPGDDPKLSAASPIIAALPKGDGPTIPNGLGAQAVLSKNLTSFPLEIKPRVFALAYGVPPGDDLPAATPLPAGEAPVYGVFGRPPVLLTATPKGLNARPWPAPKEALAKPTPVPGIAMTKTLVDELSAGPECEYGGWSYARVSQPPNKVSVLAVSKDKSVGFEIPATVDRTTPLGCGPDFVVVEALNPTDNLPWMVSCKIDGGCATPENRPFLKPAFKGTRLIGLASYKGGIIAAQTLQSPTQWQFLLSRSPDAGKLFDPERIVLEGQGDRGRLDYGALIGLGDRSLLLMSADITGTTARQWFVIASDDGAQTWNPP